MFTTGFLQFAPERYSPENNIQKISRLLEGVKADLIVLPELANSGYFYGSPADLRPYAEPGSGSGPFLSALRTLAEQIDGVIVTGFAESGPEGLYNAAAAISKDGVLQIYRKTHLFDNEKNLFLPGNSGFDCFEFRGVRIGMMICFDWVFPEAARTLALKGAQIIAHPANLVLPYCQQAMLTRSLENGVFSITANRTGSETLGDTCLNFSGASQLVDEKGNRLAQAPVIGDHLELGELDPEKAKIKNITNNNHLLDDRRLEYYQYQ
jgi:predicted amidohydrolase